MPVRRSRRSSAVHQPSAADDEFTSGENFVFELDQSVGRITRSRRSSISTADLPKPKAKARRQTMLPTVCESKVSKPVMATSPVKKFSKASTKVLNEDDILSKLNNSDPVQPKTSRSSKASTSKVISTKVKSPVKSRIPIKSPPSTKKTEVAVRRSRRVSGDAASLKPATKTAAKSTLPVITEAKPSPKKRLAQTPKKKASPKKKVPKTPVDAIKEVKKVEIKLKQMKIKEDPNLIFSLLEDSLDEDNRVDVVIDQILEIRKQATPITRNKKTVEQKSTKKSPLKPVKETKTPKKAVKSSATPKVDLKKVSPIVVKTDSTKKRKQTESSQATPVQNKRLKLDKTATPSSDSKPTRTTPTIIQKYKQATPGSLKKPLKRLAANKFTPAQVKPSDVLRRNMIRKVEKDIVTKLSNRPDTSPYTLKSGENSPVFTKVSDVKTHITGTPARPNPRRKFGTTIQPNSLLEDSVAPSTELIKRYSSSTPVRPRTSEPHPHIEATPIRPPPAKQPLSPPPELVTGKLGSFCSIM